MIGCFESYVRGQYVRNTDGSEYLSSSRNVMASTELKASRFRVDGIDSDRNILATAYVISYEFHFSASTLV